MASASDESNTATSAVTTRQGLGDSQMIYDCVTITWISSILLFFSSLSSSLANTENCSYDSMGESNNDHFQHFPPPPPILETSPFELASKKPAEIQQVNSPELGLGMTALQMQFSSAERETNGVHPNHGVNGLINGKANGNKSPPTPAVLLSPTKEPPPLLAKPKLWVFLHGFSILSMPLFNCFSGQWKCFAWT